MKILCCNQSHCDQNNYWYVFFSKPGLLNIRVTAATLIEQYTGLNCIFSDIDDNLAT